MKGVIAAAMSAAALASSAEARDFGTVGGFEISARESDADTPNSGFCAMLEEYEGAGDTRLVILRYLKDPTKVAIIIDNYNWSIVKDQEYEVKYLLGQYYYDRTALGVEDSIRKGLLTFFPADDFLPTFAKSDGFKVQKGETTVDNLDLKGSGVAVAAFDRCWTYLRSDEAVKQRERDRFKNIPKDPFKSGD